MPIDPIGGQPPIHPSHKIGGEGETDQQQIQQIEAELKTLEGEYSQLHALLMQQPPNQSEIEQLSAKINEQLPELSGASAIMQSIAGSPFLSPSLRGQCLECAQRIQGDYSTCAQTMGQVQAYLQDPSSANLSAAQAGADSAFGANAYLGHLLGEIASQFG